MNKYDIHQNLIGSCFLPTSLVFACEEHLKGGVRIHFTKGEYLFRKGDIPQGLYYIERGEIKLSTQGGTAMDQINKILKAGEIIGFNDLLKLVNYSYSAIVNKDSTLIFIPNKDFKEILNINEKGLIECDQSPFFTFMKSWLLIKKCLLKFHFFFIERTKVKLAFTSDKILYNL